LRNSKLSSGVSRVTITMFTLLALFGSLSFLTSGSAHASARAIKPHHVIAHPISLPTSKVASGSGQTQFKCQLPNAPFRCYSPQQIATAYSYTDLYKAGITGKGTTIVIVDAFQSPTILADLKAFDATFGLPDPTFNQIAPLGLTPFNPADPNQVGWAGEITLDVEWAHAVAPGATIDLVLAPSNNDIDLYGVTKYAIDNSIGQVISQSFGEGETCVDPALLPLEHQNYVNAAAKGISVLASAGDQGATQPTCDGAPNSYFLSASSPASDPYVTAVGGTQLFAKASGTYQTELVWNESDLGGFSNIGGGGGYSTIYSKPSYQKGFVTGNARGVPDISYNAAVNGGVLVYQNGGFSLSGGTSAGSPQWAGIVALANQYHGKAIGFLNPLLYNVAKNSASKAYHDITVGNNSFFSFDGTVNITGYNAKKGWDAASGLGSPIVNGLVKRI